MNRHERASDKRFTLHTNPIATLQKFPQSPRLITHAFLGEHALDAATNIRQREKLSFAHITQGNDATK